MEKNLHRLGFFFPQWESMAAHEGRCWEVLGPRVLASVWWFVAVFCFHSGAGRLSYFTQFLRHPGRSEKGNWEWRDPTVRAGACEAYPWESLSTRKRRKIPFIWLLCDAACLLSPPLLVCRFMQP